MPGNSKHRQISQRGMDYLASRGIDAVQAVTRFGLFTAHAHDGSGSTCDDSANYLGIPYTRGLTETYLQFRDMRPDVPHKDRYRSPKDSRPAIFNVDAIDDPGLDEKPLTICEGALDAIATMDTGAQRVIAIPGAEQVQLIEAARAELDEVSQIILAGHADAAGKSMNDKLSKVLSSSRCKLLSFPDGCNDLNDVLLERGRDAVIECLRGAKFIRAKGVYRPSEAPVRPPLQVMKISAFGSDFYHHIGICRRQLSVWTGLPNDGKSAMMKGLLWGLINEHGVKPGVAFYEEDFFEHTVRDLSALHLNRPITGPAMDPQNPGHLTETFQALMPWVDQNWVLIDEVEDEVCSVEQFIEQAKCVILQDGVDFILADPWSQFDVSHPQFSETEMIRRYIIELRNLAKQFNVHVGIVAHPKKHGEYGGTTKMADGNDVAGSLHFNGRCDLGVTIARDPVADNVTNVLVWKARRREMGKRGKFSLLFDPDTGRYSPLTREELALARGEDPSDVIDFNKARKKRRGGGQPVQRQYWQD